MRKVKYQVWLTPEQSPTGKRELSPERIGFFHQWGLEIEDNGEINSQTIAIIEDEKNGGVSTTYPHLVEFIDKPNVKLKSSLEDVISRFNSNVFIDNICLSYRHDFGLMAEQDKQKLRFECKEWMRSISNNWEHYKED